jgi:hypothetical protein
MQQFHAWMIKTLPPVEWYLPTETVGLPEFTHVDTSIRSGATNSEPASGETIWMASVKGREAALAFEWVELRVGVVMLSDPNSIISNINFLTQDSCYQSPLWSLISLNSLANGWAWQPRVIELVRRARKQPEPPRNSRRLVGLSQTATSVA